jgi:hypothetical protein
MFRIRYLRPTTGTVLANPKKLTPSPCFQRSIRHQAFETQFDQDELAEAREWHQSFDVESIPEGNTTFSRSSGPGGQHVNKLVFSVLLGRKLRLGHVDSHQDGNQSNHYVAGEEAPGNSTPDPP